MRRHTTAAKNARQKHPQQALCQQLAASTDVYALLRQLQAGTAGQANAANGNVALTWVDTRKALQEAIAELGKHNVWRSFLLSCT